MENNQKKPRQYSLPSRNLRSSKTSNEPLPSGKGSHNTASPSSMFYKWKRQLAVGVNASLRNTKPLKSPDLKKLEEDNRKLKELVLNQSLTIMNLKKKR